jgi:2-polyprenyl-6-methoxyphenol hydroxylase-like FAD-dependent oxidoreductase
VLGLELLPWGPLQAYVFFAATARTCGRQALLELADGVSASAFPLPGGRERFTFQVTGGLTLAPDLVQLRQLLATRLPGYRGTVERLETSGIAEFRSALATQFGRGRVWLAGDAAHTASPIAALSVNAGLDETAELAASIAETIKNRTSIDLDHSYSSRRIRHWRGLFRQDPYLPSGLPPVWSERIRSAVVARLPEAGQNEAVFLELREPPTQPTLSFRE